MSKRKRSAWRSMIALIIALILIAGIVYTFETSNPRQTEAEYLCGRDYPQYSLEWQTCVDDF